MADELATTNANRCTHHRLNGHRCALPLTHASEHFYREDMAGYECPTCGEADPYRCECSTPRERQVAAAETWWDKHVPHPENVRVVVGGDQQVRVRLIEPELRACRECGDEFETRTLDTGTKWTRLCPSCIRLHT